MSVIVYDALFMGVYIVTSLAICIKEKYNFKKPLREEMFRGVKSLCLQLPMSNVAMGVCEFGEVFSVKKCFYYLFLFDFIVFVFHYAMHSNQMLYEKIHKEHHKTIHVSPFSATILDPLEHVIVGIIPTVLPLVFVDIDKIGWTLTNLFIFLHGLIIHSTLHTPYDNLLLGSHEHATHHMFKKTHYGFLNPLWDILCGSNTYPIKRQQLIDSIVASY